MSTRARIGIENKDGTITSIYCHHDGYLAGGVGETLVVNYKDENKVGRLMELGDISSLGTEPVDNPKAWESTSEFALDPELWHKKWVEYHPDDMCDTYKSRGEDCPANIAKNLDEYIEIAENSWADFIYLFKDGDWYVVEYPYESNKNKKIKKVSKLLKK